jgi:hypothetical protein
METKADAKDFIAVMKSKLEGRNLNDILNMNQMPIPFSYHSNMTLEVKGARTVHSRASTTETKHVTLAATVTASGKLLAFFKDGSHLTNLGHNRMREGMRVKRRRGWTNRR